MKYANCQFIKRAPIPMIDPRKEPILCKPSFDQTRRNSIQSDPNSFQHWVSYLCCHYFNHLNVYVHLHVCVYISICIYIYIYATMFGELTGFRFKVHNILTTKQVDRITLD